MSIIPQAALTTIQIVSGLAASAKNAHELVRSSSDHALKGAVSELYDSVLDVKARVLELDEENRGLKAELVERANYIGPVAPHGYYFQAGRLEDPLCPKCFQSTPRIVAFLEAPYHTEVGKYERRCRICRHLYYDDGRGLSTR
jgi:hypothetical protein